MRPGFLFTEYLLPFLRQSNHPLVVAIVPGKQRFIITASIIRKSKIKIKYSIVDLNFQCPFANPWTNNFLNKWIFGIDVDYSAISEHRF
jgi:hypothetical protein